MFKIIERNSSTLHGILLIALFSCSAFYIAGIPCIKALSFSPLIVGILLGMIYANSLRNKLPETWVPGIKYCAKQILRAGIVLYGFRLTFQSVADVGLSAVFIDAIVVVSTILVGIVLGRVLKMDKDLALLTATGSAICGAAAVLGAEPVVKAPAHKTAVAVSTVVIFGTISMFLYPILFRAGVFEISPEQVGVYTGATLHEVAHVVGAGNAMDSYIAGTAAAGTEPASICDPAIIVKMIRVMMLAPVLLIMSFALAKCARRAVSHVGTAEEKTKITIPWFAFGFVAVIGVNSLLPLVGIHFLEPKTQLNNAIEFVDTFMLTMAMTALGAETSIDKFKKAGAKPFLLAALLYVWLVVGGYYLVKFF